MLLNAMLALPMPRTRLALFGLRLTWSTTAPVRIRAPSTAAQACGTPYEPTPWLHVPCRSNAPGTPVGAACTAVAAASNRLVPTARARLNAYSPYSNAKVGAAVRLKDGRIFGGCNVENSSYGATVCAERGAIQSAVAQVGKIELEEVLVITDASPAWPPCGMCRQVIAEFSDHAQLHTANLKGEYESFKFEDLQPRAFTPAHLTQK